MTSNETKDGRIGWPGSVFGSYAQPGKEEDSTRSAEIEGATPNFARRPREKHTFIPVEMQMDYESGGKQQKEPCEVAAEGFGDLRQGVEDKDARSSARITEFAVFALRGFGCSRVGLGIGSFGKELIATLRRHATVMKEKMYRKGVRPPLTNRVIAGLADATWGSEVPNGRPENSLLARHFAPWDLSSFEDYVRKDDKVEPRGNRPETTNAISRKIKQQIEIFGSVYGEEHVQGRAGVLSFLEELHGSYEEFPRSFLMEVWVKWRLDM